MVNGVVLPKEGAIPSTVFHGSISATSDVDRATLFNSYFSSVFTHSSYSLPTLEKMSLSESSLSIIEISERVCI